MSFPCPSCRSHRCSPILKASSPDSAAESEMFRADWVRRLSLARDLLELLAGGRFSATECRRQQGPFGFLRCNIEIDRSTRAWHVSTCLSRLVQALASWMRGRPRICVEERVLLVPMTSDFASYSPRHWPWPPREAVGA